MKHVCNTIILMFPLSLFASVEMSAGGNEVGNGGDVVVCRDSDKITSIELLDFYESKVKQGQEIRVGGEDVKWTIDSVIAKIAAVDPKRGKLFAKKAAGFKARTKLMKDIKLTDVPDSMHLVLPSDKACRIEQIAILEKASSTFLINEMLWNSLNPTHQAGLVFHEIIYEYFSELGEKNSIRARAYNSFVFGTFSKDEYWKFVRDLRIPIYK